MSAEYDSIMQRIQALDTKVDGVAAAIDARLETLEVNQMTESKVRVIVRSEQGNMAKTVVDELVTRLKQPKTQLAIATWAATIYTLVTQTLGRLPT